MENKGTWKVVYFPVDNYPPYIKNKWVLVKKAVTGEPLRFKARIVLLGCHQHDYDEEVYAPTAHIVTVRTIIALSVQHNETLYKLDIKDAFPQCEEKSELYTTTIEGFPLPEKPGHIALLQVLRSWYGSKQAGSWPIANRTLVVFNHTRVLRAIFAALSPLKAGEDPHQPQNLTTAELDTARASSPRGCRRGVQVRGRGARHHRWR